MHQNQIIMMMVYVSEINDMLQNMSTVDKDNTVLSVCANCGKQGIDNDMNTCNTCKQVKYCNAVCKKVHKKKHKKECDEYLSKAAEHAAELHDIELFKQPPSSLEDCPICFIRLPTLNTGRRYMACCGKRICSGCSHAPGNDVAEDKCPFCRSPQAYSDEELTKREKKRVEADDPIAMFNMGYEYRDGECGYPRNCKKALELWHRAAKLGHAAAYNSIGYAYEHGRGVEVDMNKAIHYYELAAMGGCVMSRHNLGIMEDNAGNKERALKHHMIAVRAGENDSLKEIQELYSKGHATKEDYTKALQSYQKYLGEVKSEQRDKAAAANDEYRYY